MSLTGKKIFILIVSIVFISIVSQWLLNRSIYQSIPKNQDKQPDAFLINVDYKEFDKTGRLTSHLTAPKMIHYKTRDTAIIHQPSLTFFPKNHGHYVMTADTAQSEEGLQVIHLQHHVNIHEIQTAYNSPATLITEALNIYPKRQFVETDQWVKLTQPGITMTGVGLTGDLNKGNIKLLSQTRGAYDPHYPLSHKRKKVSKGQVRSKKNA